MALGSLSTSSPTPTPTTTTNILPTSNGNPTSLYLYTFVATLALLTLIFGALVARSIHIRRRRNAAILAAIAAGTYVPPPNSKWRDDPLAPKPMLWEVHISLSQDLEKGWTTILPVAGATLVPVTQQDLRRSVGSSWSRVPYFGGTGRQSTGPPPSPTIISALEPPASSPEPVDLAVLVSMPTRERSKGGPRVVEFGVAHVAYVES
jgi:hypothetical protein